MNNASWISGFFYHPFFTMYRHTLSFLYNIPKGIIVGKADFSSDQKAPELGKMIKSSLQTASVQHCCGSAASGPRLRRWRTRASKVMWWWFFIKAQLRKPSGYLPNIFKCLKWFGFTFFGFQNRNDNTACWLRKHPRSWHQ